MLKKCTLALALALTLLNAPARADGHHITIFNRTGANIHGMYCEPAGSGEWESEDLMEGSVLLNGADMDIVFHPQADAAKWDLRVEGKEGGALEWYNIDCLHANQIILEANGVARIK